MGKCCVTIKPQSVQQWNYGIRREWSPIFPIEDPASQSRVWLGLFNATGHLLSEYPDELKQECYSIAPDSEDSFLFRFDAGDDINCWNVNPYNQQALIRLKLEVCSPIGIAFGAQGRVERKDLYFDWLIVRAIKIAPVPGSWEQIIFEHGTGENVDCEMADKLCCATVTLDPGHYILDIDMATGDGLHHKDMYWELVMAVHCDGATPACTDPACESDDAPWTPPPHDEPFPPYEPPYGLPKPTFPDPPTPGYRGECNCDHCNLVGIGIEIAGLTGGTCSQDYTCSGIDLEDLAGNLNGGYVLSDHGGSWYQDLGTYHDHSDPGIMLSRGNAWFSSGPHDGCPIIPWGDYEILYEVYAWRISGSISCTDCMVGMAPGTQWSGGAGFSFQCRIKAPVEAGGTGDWEWDLDSKCRNITYYTEAACANLDFSTLITNPCTAPPGCNGHAVYSNGANVILDESGAGCDCFVEESFATMTVTPIGSTVLCA